MSSLRKKIANVISKPEESIVTVDKVQLELPHVTEALKLLKRVFEMSANKYEAYTSLIQNDPELFGAIDTKATFIAKTLAGFSVIYGKERSAREVKLQEELNRFYRKSRKYYYDIAFKVLKDGNACYITHFNSTGLSSLEYLPMHVLTCVENEAQIGNIDLQVTKPGLFILSEGAAEQNIIPASEVVQFDYGRKEKLVDLKDRTTIGIWNESPLESLRSKLLWKSAIIFNDMIWRERGLPREHHKIDAKQFNPENFPGRTPKERYDNALKAAKQTIDDYKKSITSTEGENYPRPDQGYVTLNNVEIKVVEPTLHHTDPNELLDQIDKSIYSVYTPETTVSGRGRSTFGTEAAIMLYTTTKAEIRAEILANKLVELAIKHLQSIKEAGWTQDDFEKIAPRYNKVLERHTIIRDVAILLEGPFTPTEVRLMLNFEPLSEEDKKEIIEFREQLQGAKKHTESAAEITTKSKRAEGPAQPVTPQSEGQQQLT
jgi:hypothetical protein